MARVDFLVDTSALARSRKPAVAEVLTSLAVQGRLAVSAPVVFEIAYTGPTRRDREVTLDELSAFPYIDTAEADHKRALEVQSMLAETGRHRALSLVDALVAATAERAGLQVLHYDRDFDRIATVTDQGHTWVVPRGAAD